MVVPRWIVRFLHERAEALSQRRAPEFVLRYGKDRVAGEGQVYLRRWWLIPRNRFFNVYLHNMLGDDEDPLHDHMYASLSLVLCDGLVEHRIDDPSKSMVRHQRVLREGQIVYRSSRMAHRLVVRSPAWTVFVTGPRIKEWGFWCPKGWKHWKSYIDEGCEG